MKSNIGLLREIAPGGVLRVGINFGNPVVAQQTDDPTNPLGVGPGLARAFGVQFGIPISFVPYTTAGVMAAAVNKEWDLAFLAIDPERASSIAYTPPYMLIEGTYLVKQGSSFRGVRDVDHTGVRVAVGLKTAYDLFLSRTIQRAGLVRFKTSELAVQHFLEGGTDVVAGVRQSLLIAAERHTGYRLLAENFMTIAQAAGVPVGRPLAIQCLSEFVEEAKTSGLVRRLLVESGHGDVRMPE
jgi:polar amino acid transport system substrate-binding protein